MIPESVRSELALEFRTADHSTSMQCLTVSQHAALNRKK